MDLTDGKVGRYFSIDCLVLIPLVLYLAKGRKGNFAMENGGLGICVGRGRLDT